MKKVSNKKFPSSPKIIGKVFQRHRSCDAASKQEMSQDPSALKKEIESLKQQIDSLKTTINALKIDTENKEMKLASLAREKEKLSMALAKVKRSNDALSQQLEEERHFYYKEKEIYCHEMNEYKKLKKALSNSNMASNFDSREEIEKLRKTLEHTLQTNYNLSVKFLRMKETKNLLSNTLNKSEEEHQRVMQDLKTKIDNIREELKEILHERFEYPLSPSNKKYLQLVNRNSSLVYENLQLHIQIDQLNFQLKRNKIQKAKSETNTRIHHTCKEKRTKAKSTSTVGVGDEVIKIYEKEKRSDLPTLTFLNEKEKALRLHNSERKLKLPVVNESKLEVFQVSALQSDGSGTDVSGKRKRSRSAPKIVQSVTFEGSTTSSKKNESVK